MNREEIIAEARRLKKKADEIEFFISGLTGDHQQIAVYELSSKVKELRSLQKSYEELVSPLYPADGCFRLSARIYDLRETGMNIKARSLITPTKKRVAEYFVDKEAKGDIAKTETDTGRIVDMPDLSQPTAEGAEAILKEGLDDGRYADIVDGINIDVKQPFYQAIIRYAEDVVAAQQQPTAEGAEEILAKYEIGYDEQYHRMVYEGDALKAMYEFATLHAQRIAEKMVSERMEQYKAQFKDRPNPLEVNP